MISGRRMDAPITRSMHTTRRRCTGPFQVNYHDSDVKVLSGSESPTVVRLLLRDYFHCQRASEIRVLRVSRAQLASATVTVTARRCSFRIRV
jgi:hypothetical protein